MMKNLGTVQQHTKQDCLSLLCHIIHSLASEYCLTNAGTRTLTINNATLSGSCTAIVYNYDINSRHQLEDVWYHYNVLARHGTYDEINFSLNEQPLSLSNYIPNNKYLAHERYFLQWNLTHILWNENYKSITTLFGFQKVIKFIYVHGIYQIKLNYSNLFLWICLQWRKYITVVYFMIIYNFTSVILNSQ